MNILSLDHLVLTVRSIEATVRFYTTVLGMEARTFGNGRTALHFGAQKINLHQADTKIDQNVRHATPGSADICLLTDTPIEEVMSEFEKQGHRDHRRTGQTDGREIGVGVRLFLRSR